MEERTTTGWAGWAAFAGMMMILVGGFDVVQGLAAVIKDNFYAVTPNYIFEFDVTAWGWINIVGGAIVMFAGFGVFKGAVWARTVGVIVAFVSAVVNFTWLPYSPVWSIIVITLNVLAIYALTVHGRELASS